THAESKYRIWSSRDIFTNHECLKSFMETKVNPNYEFHNLQLEKMSLEDQIRYFDSACVVIAQHGAGLANILWMRKKSIVIELGYQSKIYFQNLSSILKHNYILFDYDEKHIEVDCTALHSKLLANDLTRPYFRE
ncbi:MAG: glycosyltransferase family 61 protein, partial [Bacteroidota bacterium]